MNLTGIFCGALITDWLGKSSDGGSLGQSFAWLAVVVLLILTVQLYFLRPKTIDYVSS
jgi:hypothetical protein